MTDPVTDTTTPAKMAERHQEGQRKTEDCGCEHIWCRGRWRPKFTCGQHVTPEMKAAKTCPAGECDGTGAVWTDPHVCTCGAGRGGYYGMHEPGCGSEPCPAGCWKTMTADKAPREAATEGET